MKTILLFSVLAIFSAAFTGCAIGPSYTTVINPFDWSDDEGPHVQSINPALNPSQTAAPVTVASR